MTVSSIYPVLMTDDVAGQTAFWTEHFGFEVTFVSDWYVSLRRDAWELAVLDHTHPTVPDGHGRPAGGVLVNLEVDDVEEQWRRLVVDGPLEALLPIRSEDFGQRHFIVAGPGGVLVDVITNIAPSGSYADAYA